jgi:outer membrane protein TolC
VLEESRVNIRYAITDAYYSALFGAERLQLARQTLERAQFNLKVIQNQLKDGVALKNDADRLALDERNAQWSLKKAEQDLALSMDNLRHQMGMPADASITLADPLMRILQLDTAMLAPRPEKRTEFQGEQLALELNALNEKKQLLRNQPTVSAYGNYALLQLNDRFNPFATGTWFPYNNLGIKASIPIYNGRQARLSADDYGLRQEINKTNLEKYKSDIDYEIRSQMKTLRQAQTDLIQSRQNIDLARQIFDTDRFRFEKGVLKQTDLKNSEYSLQTAENNYLEAVYNFLTAQLKFRKSAGLLRE